MPALLLLGWRPRRQLPVDCSGLRWMVQAMGTLAAAWPFRLAGHLVLALASSALIAGGEGALPLPAAAVADAPGLALAAGLRLRCIAPEYAAAGNGAVAHLVALPADWIEGRRYPVLVEYAPNRYQGAGAFGPLSCTGTTADCRMGFYLAGAPGRAECGLAYLWVCMPLIACDRAVPDDRTRQREATRWWGAEGEGPALIADLVGQRLAAEYLRANLPRVCARFGGDPGRVALLGFSRGAIAGGWIGRSDDATAALFRAFVLHGLARRHERPALPERPGPAAPAPGPGPAQLPRTAATATTAARRPRRPTASCAPWAPTARCTSSPACRTATSGCWGAAPPTSRSAMRHGPSWHG